MALRFPCGVMLVFLCAATASAVAAQAPQPEHAPAPKPAAANPTASPTLHDAWLFEVLDLDTKSAVAAYEKVAADQRAGNLDRWVAVARLAELKRLGVAVTLRVDLKDVPEPLRAPLASISAPLPATDLLQRAQGDPQVVLQSLGTEAGRLPPLHPVTLVAEEWRLAQIPGLREQLQREQNNRTRGTNRISDWVNQTIAADIMRAEIGGWRPIADARRALWFSNWQPPKLTGDPQPWLEKFRTNLEVLVRDPEPTPYRRDLLRELGIAVNEKAAGDPEAALALITRIPIFAERLLGLPAPTSR